MPKKIISIFLSLFLVLFSFFYTNKIVNIFKDKDPIMIEIKTYEDIDVDKSYQIMKKTGKFDKNLLVFKETENNNIKINYDDYISQLNSNKKEISIIFILKDVDYLMNTLNILKKKDVKVTFFVSKEIFDNYFSSIKSIINDGHEVELLSDIYSVYEVNKYNSMINLISKEKLRFCINIDKNESLLNACKTSKLYTIVPTIKNNTYLYIKNNLRNGSIIAFNNNKQLSVTINYILQKGKIPILLKNILD